MLKLSARGAGPVVIPLDPTSGPRVIRLAHKSVRGLVDNDIVEVVPNDRFAPATFIERRRRLVVGVVQDSPNGGQVIDPDPGIAGSWVHLPPSVKVRSGEAVAVSIKASGRCRASKVVAGPWLAGSIEHLQAVALVRANGAPVAANEAWVDDAHARLSAALRRTAPNMATSQAPARSPRADFTADAIVTIDGPETSDIDDAVWAAPVEGGWRVRVHIADVASAIGQGTPLDHWAVAAATSVYLPASTTHMLPPELSEGRCSLLPLQARDTVTAEFTVTEAGSVEDVSVTLSKIVSKARLTYTAVDEFLTGSHDAVPAEVLTTVEAAGHAAAALANRRDGAASFPQLMQGPSLEAALRNGRVAIVDLEGRTPAHRLIEELMVAANEAVGVWLADRSAQAIYRTQPGPDVSLATEIAAIAELFDTPLHPDLMDSLADDGQLTADELGQLLAGLEGGAYEAASARSRRAMQRAVYTPGPGSHFQLETTHYLHFTSPIRRYADLVVHRIIHATLAGDPMPYTPAELGELAAWISERSSASSLAEGICDRMFWCIIFDARLRAGKTIPGTAVISHLSPGGAAVRVDDWGINGQIRSSHFGPTFRTSADGLTAEFGVGDDALGHIRVGAEIPVVVVSADPLIGEAVLGYAGMVIETAAAS